MRDEGESTSMQALYDGSIGTNGNAARRKESVAALTSNTTGE
jgi:hypothetical protein